jgi:hypothetical protein
MVDVMCKKIRILILVFIQLSLGCTVQNNHKKIDGIDMIDIVVVFKKDITNDQAKMIMDRLNLIYHEGMDSSRGKSYFYKTGPKFIAKIEPQQEKSLISKLNKYTEIYEVYQSDWKIIKD